MPQPAISAPPGPARATATARPAAAAARPPAADPAIALRRDVTRRLSALESRAMNGESQGIEVAAPSFVFDSTLLQEAYELARSAHDDQRRRDGGPYVGHPVGVALRLHEEGYGEQVLAAALLHDVVEHAEL